jgi:hypothetical protein
LSVFYPETARKSLEELDFIFDKPGQGLSDVMAMTKDVEAKSVQIRHVELFGSKVSKV